MLFLYCFEIKFICFGGKCLYNIYILFCIYQKKIFFKLKKQYIYVNIYFIKFYFQNSLINGIEIQWDIVLLNYFIYFNLMVVIYIGFLILVFLKFWILQKLYDIDLVLVSIFLVIKIGMQNG